MNPWVIDSFNFFPSCATVVRNPVLSARPDEGFALSFQNSNFGVKINLSLETTRALYEQLRMYEKYFSPSNEGWEWMMATPGPNEGIYSPEPNGETTQPTDD